MLKFNHRGFSLIELMIALVIGILVMGLALEMYITAHGSIAMQNALHEIQDNAQIAIEILSQEIKRAGNIGCAKLDVNFPITSHVAQTLTAANKISGNVKELTVRYADFPHAVLTENMRDHETLLADNNVSFDPGNIVLISDCKHAEIFKIKKIESINGKQEIYAESGLSHKFEALSEISRLVINQYFVDKTRRRHNDRSIISALYMRDIHGMKTEIVPDVETLHITWHKKNAKLAGLETTMEMKIPPLKKTWHAWFSLV